MSLMHAGQQPSVAASGETPDQASEALGKKLLGEFQDAEKAKRVVEPRLLQCLRQYKGVYDPETVAKIGKDKAAVFIRHTAAKVDATKARLMDLLFPSNGALNWEITPSPRPSVDAEMVALFVQAKQATGEDVPQDQDALVTAAAAWSADLMSKKISDQLLEPTGVNSYPRVCDRVILSGFIYGTGIKKGPLVMRNEQKRFVRQGDGSWVRQSVAPDEEYKPFVCHVPVWNFFPDPSAIDPSELMYCWEEHLLSRSDFMALGKNPGFNAAAIMQYIDENKAGDANLTQRQTEVRATSKEETSDGGAVGGVLRNRYRVLERWGYLNGDELLEAGVSPEDIAIAFPDGFSTSAAYAACVWMTSKGGVIKASLAPIEGVAIPYCFFQPYKDESSFWAEGLCDRIRDPQIAINAMARMTLDHASITTLPQIGINMSALSTSETEPHKMSSGKVWLFDTAEDMNSCMRVIELQSHIPEIMAIGEKFSQWSDETSTPRYMSGDNAGVRGAGDTAAGLSMLMGAASLPTKDQVRQFDAMTEQFITNVYNWNMKFSHDPRIKGDFDIIARGSTALIAQELQGQHILQVMSVLASPVMEDKVDFDSVLKHVLHYMSLPDNLQLSPAARKQAKFENMKLMQAAQISALMEEAQKQGIAPAQVLQSIAQSIQAVPEQAAPVPVNSGMARIPTPQEVPNA